MMMEKRSWLKGLVRVFAVALLMLSALAQAHATPFLTAPDAPHEEWNRFPFGNSNFRYQQVYDASLFPGPVEIVSLAFSPRQPLDYIADLEIRLTQTTVAVGALSSNLDDNFSGSLTTVFDNPAFTADLTSWGEESFSLVFDFSPSPFFYDPSSGANLLVDIVTNTVINGPSVSRAGFTGLSSRAWNGGDGFMGTDGDALRTRIGYVSGTPVPEPGTALMVGSGLLSVGLFGRKSEK